MFSKESIRNVLIDVQYHDVKLELKTQAENPKNLHFYTKVFLTKLETKKISIYFFNQTQMIIRFDKKKKKKKKYFCETKLASLEKH